ITNLQDLIEEKYINMKIKATLTEVFREPQLGDICHNFFYGYFVWTKLHIKNGSRTGSQEYSHYSMKIYEISNIK
ncbi:MAG: hypothetical protein ABIP51_12410, partial [Bacteroidia bacterium]